MDAASRLGDEVYCPKETCVKIHRRDPTKTRRLYEKPLFPGYMFVPQDFSQLPEDWWLRYLGTGVAGYLMHWDGKHLQLSDAEIERVKRVESQIKADVSNSLKPKQHKVFQPGDTTQILRGLLVGAMARVVSVYNRRIEVDVRGRNLIVDVTMLR